MCFIATPSALAFLDVPALQALTGHRVRSHYKRLGDPDVLPGPDEIVVAPATSSSINKWTAGIADTLALGLLTEAIGKGLPVLALPFVNNAQAKTAFHSLWVVPWQQGGRVLMGADGLYYCSGTSLAYARRPCRVLGSP